MEYVSRYGFVGILIVCICAAFLLSPTFHADPAFVPFLGQKISFTGTIAEEPSASEKGMSYVVKPDHSSTLVIVKADAYPVFEYSDTVNVMGIPDLPKSFETAGGTTFDYPAYLARKKVGYIISFAHVKKTASHVSLQKYLFRMKDGFMHALEKVIPYPESGLLGGILLGYEDGISQDLLTSFQMVGIIHIVVLSGYNITIVAESVQNVLRFLSKRKALFISALFVILFILMVGATPSVVRAGIMAMIALLAKGMRRTYNVGRALALAATVMIVWNPSILLHDLGFELSFLATIALIWISPLVIPRLTWLTEKWGIRDVAGTTIAVQLFVTPLLIYSSGYISLSGFIVNVLVLPIVPSLMLLGFLVGALALISSALAFIPGLIARGALWYIITLSEKVSAIKGSVVHVSGVSGKVPLIFYSLVAVSVCIFKILKHRADSHRADTSRDG